MSQAPARRAALAMLFCLLAAPAGAAEPASPAPLEQGPVSSRNQFPLNWIFFSFPFRSGSVLPRGHREVEVLMSYANTFAGSDDFLAFDTGDRKRLTEGDVNNVQADNPGESLFFMDTEQSRISLVYRSGIGRRLEWNLELPFITYLGGVFDSFIESYHRSLGLGNSGREFYDQDAVQMALTWDGKQYFADSSPASFELGDVALTGRLALTESPRGAAAVSLAVKFPTGDADHLAGSGSLDAGLAAEGTLRGGKQRLHLSAAWVRSGSRDLLPSFHPGDIASFGMAYEYVRSTRLSWIGQVQTQRSVFRGAPQANGSLADYSTEVLAGARWRGEEGRWSFQTALIENIINQNNGIDIGLLAGFGIGFGAGLTSPASGEAAKYPLP